MQNVKLFPPFQIEPDEDEEHGGEAPEGGAAVAEEGERDSYDRNKTYCHAYVYEKVHEETTGYAVAVYADKRVPLALRKQYDSYNHKAVEQNYRH